MARRNEVTPLVASVTFGLPDDSCRGCLLLDYRRAAELRFCRMGGLYLPYWQEERPEWCPLTIINQKKEENEK